MSATPEGLEFKKYDELTMFQKMQVWRAIALFPAITVMVFMRRKIGFRMMKPNWLVAMTVILCLIPLFLSGIAAPFGFLMPLYAFAMLGMGLYQRWKRWGELCSGERWHTYSAGISYFEMLPLPAFLQSHGRIYRFLDPIAVVLVGLIVSLALSHGLGIWIMFSGLALHIFEQDVYEKAISRDLDTLDGLIASEVQDETVKHFAGAQPEEKRRTLEDTAGIPTGLAPDIHRQVELRRARVLAAAQAATAKPAIPDNLATET